MKGDIITRREILKTLGLAGYWIIAGCPSSNPGGGDGGGGGGGNGEFHSIVLYAIGDTYTSSENPATNYGREDIIQTGEIHTPQRSASFRGYVKFDVSSIPRNARIDSAIFSMSSVITASRIQPIATVDIDKLTLNPWQEGGLTHNSSFNHMEFISSSRIILDGRVHNWDVKQAVRGWVAGEPNYGFTIKGRDIDDGYGGDDHGVGFISRELAQRTGLLDIAPKLTIDYLA
ncbi:MAG: DNRLRE domain-containing protein [Candidatus Pacearchaeota archaeon]